MFSGRCTLRLYGSTYASNAHTTFMTTVFCQIVRFCVFVCKLLLLINVSVHSFIQATLNNKRCLPRWTVDWCWLAPASAAAAAAAAGAGAGGGGGPVEDKVNSSTYHCVCRSGISADDKSLGAFFCAVDRVQPATSKCQLKSGYNP